VWTGNVVRLPEGVGSFGARSQNGEQWLSFVMSVRPSVRPHGTTRPPLDGFSYNLVRIFLFENLSEIDNV
jgi:hypothetical protein